MTATYERQRAIAVWLARAWAITAPVLLFCFLYFGGVWMVSEWGYVPNRAYILAFALFGVLVNSHELVGDLLRALRYPVNK